MRHILMPILICFSPIAAGASIGEAAQDKVTSTPQATSPTTTYDGYPITAMRERREGTSGYRFTIGDDGQMKNCRITQSSGHADLDAATCPRLRRFPPPGIIRDEQGKAVKGNLYQGLMSWKLQ